MRPRAWRAGLAPFALASGLVSEGTLAEVPVDDLTDLTGRASAVVTLKAHDNFSNEFTFDVRVRNHTASALEAANLVLVLDHATDLAGKNTMNRVEAVGQDGQTRDGKPYFRVPGPVLAPYGESGAVTVRLRNPDYVALWTPSFRVLGTAQPDPGLQAADALDRLIQLLIKKGLLTEEEWTEAVQPTSPDR